MEKQLNTLKSVFKQRETEVAELKRENKQALDKLDRLGKGTKDTVQKQLSEDNKSTGETKTKKRKKEKKKSPASYVGFVASQIRTDMSSEDEDIQCSQVIQLDSTQSRKRKSSENAPSEAGSMITELRHGHEQNYRNWGKADRQDKNSNNQEKNAEMKSEKHCMSAVAELKAITDTSDKFLIYKIFDENMAGEGKSYIFKSSRKMGRPMNNMN